MARETKPSYYWCVAKPGKRNSTVKRPGLAVPVGGPFASVQDCLLDAMDEEEEDQINEIWIGTEITDALTLSECSSPRAVSEVFDGIAAALRDCIIGSGYLLVVEEEQKKALAELSSFLARWAPTFLSSNKPRMVLAAATKHQLPDRDDEEVALKTWLDSCPVPLDQKLSASVHSLLQTKRKTRK